MSSGLMYRFHSTMNRSLVNTPKGLAPRAVAVRRAGGVTAKAVPKGTYGSAEDVIKSPVTVVLGSQWGDEGKGKLVDILAKQYDVVARAQGGANAGHTIYDDAGNKYALHLVPSGILNKQALCVVGNGVVMHVPGFFEEVDKLEAKGVKCEGRIKISERAHLLFDLHKEIDGLREEELAGGKIGTTKRGIGPCYASKATRNGLRVSDLRNMSSFRAKLETLVADTKKRFPSLVYDVDAEVAKYEAYAQRLKPYVADTITMIDESITSGKRVLVEGANATMLDIDFGTYPFVTSSNPSIGGIITGLGIAPRRLGAIVGVAKAYTTRVGSGPYPTEIDGKLAEDLRAEGHEYGTTTGRPRRIGWLDIPALRYACVINGFTSINLTKLDVLSKLPEIKLGVAYKDKAGNLINTVPADVEDIENLEVVYETMPGWMSDISQARKYEDLPAACRSYVDRIETLIGVPISWIGVGPQRVDMCVKQ